jgi:flagellar hook-basal body complex protein FliE
MEQIKGVGFGPTQGQMLQEMQRMSSAATHSAAESMSIAHNGASSSSSFKQVMAQALGTVNSIQQDAIDKQTAMNMGTSDDLVGTMLASQKASISFSALVQVRNKVASGVEEIMGLSI